MKSERISLKIFYNFGIYLLELAFWVGRFFSNKLKIGYLGRKNWQEELSGFRNVNTGKLIWIHCASLGEFEMARPLIEELKENYKDELSIVLTFFSPSGFELRKDYQLASRVFYLPFDTQYNAKKFVALLKPDLAVFVKYEFWLNYLKVLKNTGTKTILINGIFRKSQSFFKWYGAEFRKALKSFDHVFLQNNQSRILLEGIGIDAITVTGDLRYDRVLAIAQNSKSYPILDQILKDKFVLIGGSTWAEEEKLIKTLLNEVKENLRIIVAPHDISESHLTKIEKLLYGISLKRFSHLKESDEPTVILIDTIGHLSSIYKYGNAALVGGGFSGALHNILEPGVFGIPLFFGSSFRKFPEAKYFIESGIGHSINSSTDFVMGIKSYMTNKEKCQEVKLSAARIFKANSGGTHQVYFKIKGFLNT